MTRKIILIILLLLLEAFMGYYSLIYDGSLFARFIFFLLSSGLVCIIVLRGVQYILPANDMYAREEQKNLRRQKRKQKRRH